MDTKKDGGSSSKILTVAIIIALLGIAFGAYEALQPKSVSSVTLTSTIAGPTITTASVSTFATIVTISGSAQPAKVSSITVGATSNPQGMAFNPTNNKIYVALQNSSSVAVINATTSALITTIPLTPGDQPVALAYDSANNMVYVANSNASTIPVINSATDALASTITVPDTTNGIAINPTTNTVYLASNDDDAMFFINGATSQVSILQEHGGIPDNAQAVAVDTANGMVFVGNWYHTRTAAEFGFISTSSSGKCATTNTNSSNCVAQSLTLTGGQIVGVAVNPNTGMIYVANIKADVVNVISESTGKDVANITAPSPYGVTVDPNTNVVYVASTSSNSLLVISGSTNAILGTVPVGSGPVEVGIDTNTNTVYVSNQADGTISVIDGTSLLF